ncbi:MAG: hypothetical protein HS100_17395 [Anaerolineales bacterium]|nr:hypothetical protein [Anaerolineales bacterium]
MSLRPEPVEGKQSPAPPRGQLPRNTFDADTLQITDMSRFRLQLYSTDN